MRAGEFIPCDYGKCYFYINGHTNGIAHAGKKKGVGPPVLVKFKCNKRTRMEMETEKCADVNVKERVDIQKGSDY